MSFSAPAIRARKRRNGAIPLVMVTAYDEPGARLASAAGVDLILVGDSMANVVLGQETRCTSRSMRWRTTYAPSPRRNPTRTSWPTCRG